MYGSNANSNSSRLNSALKIQMHSMYFDTSFNTLGTALANLYRLFHDAAQRAEHYIRSMPKRSAPSFETVKGTFVLDFFSPIVL